MQNKTEYQWPIEYHHWGIASTKSLNDQETLEFIRWFRERSDIPNKPTDGLLGRLLEEFIRDRNNIQGNTLSMDNLAVLDINYSQPYEAIIKILDEAGQTRVYRASKLAQLTKDETAKFLRSRKPSEVIDSPMFLLAEMALSYKGKS